MPYLYYNNGVWSDYMKDKKVLYITCSIISILLSCLYIYLLVLMIIVGQWKDINYTPGVHMTDGIIGFLKDYLGVSIIGFFIFLILPQVFNIVFSILLLFVRNKSMYALSYFFGLLSLTFANSISSRFMKNDESFETVTVDDQFVLIYKFLYISLKIVSIVISVLGIISIIHVFSLIGQYQAQLEIKEGQMYSGVVEMFSVLCLLLFLIILHIECLFMSIFSTAVNKKGLRVASIILGCLTGNYIGVFITIVYWPYFDAIRKYKELENQPIEY